MIAEQAKLAALLEGSKQFEVPLYQRRYSWDTPEREQFWRDIVRSGRDARPTMHFTGSVVYMERPGSMAGNLKRARLIDGQQRLTTLTLLMLALSERLAEVGELELPLEGTTDSQRIEAEDLRSDYLLNRRLSGDSRYKLLPTHADRDTLKHLLGDAPPPDRVSAQMQAGVDFFRRKLAEPGVDLREVLRGVHKLQVVAVTLEEGRDDPQLIFESLNSTGKDLTQADLIRNNVLMGLSAAEQDSLSRDYWVPMEALFADTEPGTFDRFMRDFLTLRTRALPNEDEVYTAFKAYRGGRPPGETVQELVGDLLDLGRLYMAIVQPQREPDPGVRQALADLLSLRIRVVQPLALEMLQDRHRGVLDSAALERSLRATESFLVRRAVTGERTSPLNRFFATVGRDLPKEPGKDYAREVQRALVRFQDSGRDGFPTDQDFLAALQTTPLYRSPVCRPLLLRLERKQNPKEWFGGTLTIEHVMPQNANLSEAWRQDLGEDWQAVQQQWVHTLGNLTLTGYNSELGDRPFADKKHLPPRAGDTQESEQPKGYKYSRLLLTQELADDARYPTWNAAVIEQRGRRLAQEALGLFAYPDLPPEEIEELRRIGRQPKLPTVEGHLDTSGQALRSLYMELRQRLLALDEGVTEDPKKFYVAYKVGSNFCLMVPQPSLNTVKCWLNIAPQRLDDPLGLTRDITGKEHPGNGNIELVVSPDFDLDEFERLARQALEYQLSRQSKSKDGPKTLVDFSKLPPQGVELLEELERRCQDLGAQARDRAYYRAFHNPRVFLEVYPLRHGLKIAAKQTPDSLRDDEQQAWANYPSTKAWVHRPLHTLEDLEEAWPVIVRAAESVT